MKQLEIERKFLLKRLPNVKWSHPMVRIEQCYTATGRYRMMTYPKGKVKFVLTKKKELRPGVYEEDERFIQAPAYLQAFVRRKRILRKHRHYKLDENGMLWEIDLYTDFNLVIAECELPKEGFKLKIPKFIKKELIMEVSAFEQFKNSKLAE